MRCDEIRKRIAERALSSPLSALDPELAAHLKNCPACSSLARAHDALADDLNAVGAAAGHDLPDFQTLQQNTEIRLRQKSAHKQETGKMAQTIRYRTIRQRLGFSLAAVAVIVIAAILIPWQIGENPGYELAVAGVDESLISSGALSELLAAVGLPNAEISTKDCNPKCLVVIGGLATAEEAQTAAAAMKKLPDVHITTRDEFIDQATGRTVSRSFSTQTIEDGRWTIEHGIDTTIEARVTIALDSLVAREPVTWTEWIHHESDSTGIRNVVEKLPNGGYREILILGSSPGMGWNKTAWTFDSNHVPVAYTVTDTSGVDHDIDFNNWAVMEKQLEAVGWYHMITFDDSGTPYLTSTNAKPKSSPSHLAEGMYLKQNEPNPFDTMTTITIGLPETARVKIKLYNMNSNLVRTLVDDVMAAGEHKITWDGRDDDEKRAWSRTWICKLEVGEYYSAITMAQVWGHLMKK